MIWLYHTFLYQPLFNLLIFFYNIIPGQDIGVAIILLTLVIKLILWPLSKKSLKAQKEMQEIQPKMNALREKYKDDKEKLAQETMKLYKENKVNPFSSCLPLLIQFPFLIAVYQVFRSGLANNSFDQLYSFINNPGTVDPMFLGFMDMAAPSIVLAILAGIGQYISGKMLSMKNPPTTAGKGGKDEKLMADMNKSMLYFMPLLTIFIGSTLPAGLTLYWFLTTVLTVVQQKFFLKPITPNIDNKVIDVKAEEITNKKNEN